MSVTILNEKNLISIEGKDIQYIIGIDSNMLLRHVYFGKKLCCSEDFEIKDIKELSSNDPVYELSHEEYSPYGGLRYKEPCLKVEFEDGTRDLILEFVDSCIDDDILSIRLEDRVYSLIVILKYRIYEDLNIIERWAEITNNSNYKIVLESVQSAEFTLPYKKERCLTNVSGHWAGEQRKFREKLGRGKRVLESRRGNSSHNHNPYFILDNNADENKGEVYYGTLGITGNFKITIEVTPYDTTRILAGINDFDFSWVLGAGETFITPSLYIGYTDSGFNGASHSLHNLANKYIIPLEHRKEIAPVLYNSWEATGFAVQCSEQMQLAEQAAEIGVELFVVDDGWFGGRNSDRSGLGDWYPNENKFPEGLAPLINKINSLGMSFGLWVEPEMVNEDSELYRNHKDWVYGFNNRRSSTSRNQLVLNLTKEEVCNYLYKVLDELLSNNNINYIKWDSNRPFSESGALNLDIDCRKTVYHRHMLAFYNIAERLRKKHPKVWFECCASGGGRIDFGSLKYFDQFWLSDNTDALDRLYMQEAYSLVYPMKVMRAWVTDCPNFISNRYIPLEFRFHSAMMGALGIGGNINKWSHDSLEASKRLISEYKSIRHIIQGGRIFRLSSLESSDLFAVEYMIENAEGIVLIYSRGQNFGLYRHNVIFIGLDRTAKYTISCNEEVLGCNNNLIKHGDYLCTVGLDVFLKGEFRSALIKFTKV